MAKWLTVSAVVAVSVVAAACGDAAKSADDRPDFPGISPYQERNAEPTHQPKRPDWVPADTPPPETNCGDGEVDGREVCDAGDLDGATCADFGFKGGELSCLPSCAGFEIEDCRGLPDHAESQASEQACAEGAPLLGRHCPGECQPNRLGGRSYRIVEDLRDGQVEGQLSLPESYEHIESLPDGATGKLLFANRASGAVATTEIAPTQEGQPFSVRLFAGSYRVAWKPGFRFDNDVPLSHVFSDPVDATSPDPLQLALPPPIPFRVQFGVPGKRKYDDFVVRIEPLAKWSSHVDSVRRTFNYRSDYLYLFPGRYDLWVDRERLSDIPPRRWKDREFAHVHTTTLPAPNDREDMPRPEPRFYAYDGHNLRIESTVDTARADDYEVELAINGFSRHGRGFHSRVRLRTPTTLFVQPGTYEITASLHGPHRREPISRRTETVEVGADERVHFDFDVHRVTGRLPAEPGRPPVTGTLDRPWERAVRFVSDEGRVFEADDRHDDVGSYEVHLPDGEYDVYAGPVAGSSGMIDGQLRVLEDVPIDRDTELDIRHPRTELRTLRGEVTVNGERLPDLALDRAHARAVVKFTCLEGCLGFGRTVRIGKRGPARYRASLLPGVYRVDVLTRNWGSRYKLPSASWTVDPELRVQKSHRRDFDLKLVHVLGEISISQPVFARPPDDSRDLSWKFDFTLSSTADGGPEEQDRGPIQPIRRNHEPTFEFWIYPGIWKLESNVTVSFPDGDSDAHFSNRNVAIASDRHLKFEIPVRRLTGRLTWNGETWPTSEDPLGEIAVETDFGKQTEAVGSEGTFTLWHLGRSPRVEFSPDARQNVLPRTPDVLLRAGCER